MNRAPLASVKAADMNGDLDMRTSKDFEMVSKSVDSCLAYRAFVLRCC